MTSTATKTAPLPRANVRRANARFPREKYVHVKDVPIFAEHETTARNGRKLKFTKKELRRVAERCNRRITETGDYAMLTVGHTPEPGSGLPAPEVIGFVGPYRMGTLGEPGQRQRYAILADFWVRKDDWSKFEKNPRRSVELWLEEDLGNSFLDPIACLGAEPGRLDLGLTTGAKGTEHLDLASAAKAKGGDGASAKGGYMYSARISGRVRERYSMASPSAAMPSATNTFIPDMGGKKKKYKAGNPAVHEALARQAKMRAKGTETGTNPWKRNEFIEQAKHHESIASVLRAFGDKRPIPELQRQYSADPSALSNKGQTGMLTPEDLKQILSAFEQLDWVQELKAMLEERRAAQEGAEEGGAPGEMPPEADMEGEAGPPMPGDEGGEMPPEAAGMEEPDGDEGAGYGDGDEYGDEDYPDEDEEAPVPGKQYCANKSIPAGGLKKGGKKYGAMGGAIGAAAGGLAGGPIGAGIGAGLGSAAGDAISPEKNSRRPAMPSVQYSLIMAKVDELQAANQKLQQQVAGETEKRINAERRQVLYAWAQHRAMDVTKEIERCKYTKMPDDNTFAEHVEAIRDNYQPVPLDSAFPIPEEEGLAVVPDNGTERYSRDTIEKATRYCIDQQVQGKGQPRYEAVLEAFASGKSPA